MKTAVIYARYSSDSQTEQSIEGQLHVCEEYAKKNDYLIVDTYIDRAMTGTNDNRPAFRQMIKASAKKTFDFVIVYKLDRFSRNKFEMTMHRHTLKENGVKLLSAMENIPDTPEGIILESLLEGMNQYYSEELSQKVRRGMRETRQKGLYQGGGLPYGYKVDGRKIVIDEESAEVVRYIFSQYSIGVYAKDIIKELNSKGVLHKGKPWALNTVYGMLANLRYSGSYYHGDELIDNMYPRIVEDSTFQLVREKVEKNKFGKRSVKTVYLLRDKLICGYCGKSISAETGTTSNKTVRHYYKCIGRKKYQNGCQKTTVRKEFLEELVINAIVEQMNKPKIMDKIIKGLMKQQDDHPELIGTLNVLQKEKRKVETMIANVMSAIEQGVVTKTTHKRLSDLEHQLDELDRQIIIERNKTSIKFTEEEMREYYTKALELEPQMLISYLVKKIVMFNDKIEIHFNSPLISSDESQGFSVYSGTYTLKYIIQNKPALGKQKVAVSMYIG